MKHTRIVKFFREGLQNLTKKERKKLIEQKVLPQEGEAQVRVGKFSPRELLPGKRMIFLNTNNDGGFLAQPWRLCIPEVQLDSNGEIQIRLVQLKETGSIRYQETKSLGQQVVFTQYGPKEPNKGRAGIWTSSCEG